MLHPHWSNVDRDHVSDHRYDWKSLMRPTPWLSQAYCDNPVSHENKTLTLKNWKSCWHSKSKNWGWIWQLELSLLPVPPLVSIECWSIDCGGSKLSARQMRVDEEVKEWDVYTQSFLCRDSWKNQSIRNQRWWWGTMYQSWSTDDRTTFFSSPRVDAAVDDHPVRNPSID